MSLPERLRGVGVNVTQDGSDDLQAIAAAGFAWIRVACNIADEGPPHVRYDLRAYLQQARSLGLGVLLVFDRDAFLWTNWRQDTTRYVEHWLGYYDGLYDAIMVGNEPDLTSPSSWTMDAQTFADLLTAVRTQVGRDVYLIAGGLASGQPSYLAGVDLTPVDAVGLHPYTKQAQDMPAFLASYVPLVVSRDIVLDEWGCPAGWGLEEQARQTADMIRWCSGNGASMAIYDWRGDEFGLSAADGSPRPVMANVTASLATFAKFQSEAQIAISPPDISETAISEEATVPDYRAEARAAAERHGLDPDIFERQIGQESGFDPNAHNPSGADGIAQIIASMHPGVDTRDPIASMDYAAAWEANLLARYGGSYAHALAAYNWGPGNVDGWDGQRSTLPSETQHYLDVILGNGWEGAATVQAPTYNPDMPIVYQQHDWDCCEQSLWWAMTSFGRHPSDPWMEQQMIADHIESTDLGLLVGSGGPLADWVTAQWGEFGYSAYNRESASFDDVAALAGSAPVLIGGHNWGGPGLGHWSAVRRYDAASDTLSLANPGGTGPLYGQQTLTRDQFARLSPFSAVAITWGSQAEVPTPAPAPISGNGASGPLDDVPALQAQLAAVTVERDQYKHERDSLISAVAYLGDDIGDRIVALVDEVRRVRQEQVGPRPKAA